MGRVKLGRRALGGGRKRARLGASGSVFLLRTTLNPTSIPTPDSRVPALASIAHTHTHTRRARSFARSCSCHAHRTHSVEMACQVSTRPSRARSMSPPPPWRSSPSTCSSTSGPPGMRYINVSHFRHARFHLEQEIERVAAISRAQAEPHEMLNQHHRGAGLVRRKSSINGPEKSKISKISKMAPGRPSSGMQMA